MSDSQTPKLDNLEQGPWPSFVTEIKKAGDKSPAARGLLKQLEMSYNDRITHWKHGGIVGVRSYGAGVIGRYSDSAEQFPEVTQFHTLRVNQPSGWFYSTKSLRQLCDVWEKYGSGLTNMHGATGDIILLGTTTDNLQTCFDSLSNEAGYDLGGSGSALRTPSCCLGPARCEWSCIDTLDFCNDLTHEFQNEIHRPMWPYKFKIKISGCPNDCVASIARSDLAVIGTWHDHLQIDQEEVRNYVKQGLDIKNEVVSRCPTSALEWDEKTSTLKFTAEDCVRCMHCINRMTRAISIGKERGASLLIGGKAPIKKGAFLAWVIVPFMKLEPPYTEFKDLIRKIWDWWDENGNTRERVGELIERMGFPTFLREVGLKPQPQMISSPRTNPYMFWHGHKL